MSKESQILFFHPETGYDEQGKKRISDRKIWAIQQVLTANSDVVELLGRRGVTSEDLEVLCSQAMSESSPWRRKDV